LKQVAPLAAAALLAMAMVGALALGPLRLPVGDVMGALGHLAGLPMHADPKSLAVVGALRLPRAILAALAGAVLGLAGAMTQGLFRNPLADPGVLGIAGGASLGAVSAIFFGLSALSVWALPTMGFAGGLAAALLVGRIARSNGRTPVATLLLAGIAVNALAMSLTGIIVYASDDRQLRDISLWLMGSVGGATPARIWVLVPFAALLLVGLPFFARGLDALMLGECEAVHLGIGIETLKAGVIGCVALAVGAVVSCVGPIGFVGLVVPHIGRMFLGPGHRLLLPVSALAGAALLVAADTFARLVVAPAELPVGLVTAAIGAPFFAAMVTRSKRRLAT
jgi:iron complex transport system permease protein